MSVLSFHYVGFQRSNLGPQPWWQAPLPAEASHWTFLAVFETRSYHVALTGLELPKDQAGLKLIAVFLILLHNSYRSCFPFFLTCVVCVCVLTIRVYTQACQYECMCFQVLMQVEVPD